MSDKTKKIISTIIKGGFEFTKDSAKQIAGTVSPGALLEQVLGTQKKEGNELTEYLKNLGDPNLKGEKLKEKEMEMKSEDEKKIEEARKKLFHAAAIHMRSATKPPGLRPHEATIQEEERKKAAIVEAQKKTPGPVFTPAGKKPPGMPFGKRKTGGKGFEGLIKDAKVG